MPLLIKRDICLAVPISSGIPFNIIDTCGTIDTIDARSIVDAFHPVLLGIVDILDAFDIRN